ncbi:right-handed parallel beta-helix repeat-containing protein [Tenacibaculum agarivorans]|uniref:hypothetical protein n=1 Tax=Tenacibaculum agarivorans TaxID=1908389 RepID=UPI00094BA366|nr:hypothetical protein [Tenacibaculum agarivorans]
MSNKPIKFFLLTLVLLFISCSENILEDQNTDAGNTQDEELNSKIKVSNFYTFPSDSIKRVQFTGTTTQDLNRFINQNKAEGAIIEIPKATYTWGRINLRSNIHLEIEGGTVIKPELDRGAIFNIGASKQGNRLKNVSIRGVNGRFTIDLCDPSLTNKFIAAARIGRVDNFLVEKFNIKDRRSILNSILMIHVSGAPEVKPGANSGIVRNISQTGAHTGYGLVQTYNCDNVLFRNLKCVGGITLRLETDDRAMKNDIKNGIKQGGVNDIFAENIRNTNGLAALMLSPHFVQNGKVTTQNIVANSSGFAVRYDSGGVAVFDGARAFPLTDAGRIQFMDFVSNQFPGFSGNAFKGNAFKRNNGTQWAVTLSPEVLDHPNRSQFIKTQIGDLKAGRFDNPTATKVTANYGTKAKLKQNQLRFIPCNQWTKIKDPGTSLGLFKGFEYEGPSVGLILGDGISISQPMFNNFPSDFIQNVILNGQAICNNDPNTIQQVRGQFPSCN